MTRLVLAVLAGVAFYLTAYFFARRFSILALFGALVLIAAFL